MAKHLQVLLLPLVLVFVNFSLLTVLISKALTPKISDIFDLLFVSVVIIYAGSITIARLESNLWRAAIAGVIILFFDHVILNGGWLLYYVIEQDKPFDEIRLTLQGIVFSFLILLPVAMLLGLLGGWVGKKLGNTDSDGRSDLS